MSLVLPPNGEFQEVMISLNDDNDQEAPDKDAAAKNGSSSAAGNRSNNKNSNKTNRLLQRIGDDDTFDFAVVELCDRIMHDKELKPMYKIYDHDSLKMLQKESIMLAASAYEADKDAIKSAKSRWALRHYRLLDMGLQQKHLDKVALYLEECLLASWVESDVVQDVMNSLKSFQLLSNNDTSTLREKEKRKQKPRSSRSPVRTSGHGSFSSSHRYLNASAGNPIPQDDDKVEKGNFERKPVRKSRSFEGLFGGANASSSSNRTKSRLSRLSNETKSSTQTNENGENDDTTGTSKSSRNFERKPVKKTRSFEGLFSAASSLKPRSYRVASRLTMTKKDKEGENDENSNGDSSSSREGSNDATSVPRDKNADFVRKPVRKTGSFEGFFGGITGSNRQRPSWEQAMEPLGNVHCEDDSSSSSDDSLDSDDSDYDAPSEDFMISK